ncbi:hypothetical protein SPRG_12674 [Saprolegnia parasitica CBS 223.65]|uniref:Uncharacterized protein n=1 Tax=Saprolegnia parasitica (strain CBS 223.65) TaxID=695850 RepID=A0A067BVB4_SAPPC|nr:hypothetical protein SPRG_12674 [Saprolegnia parasitica CBS 223.65]KDO22178.1 hypothetical protein SPRG_12674 [Saprolegnia parasitica CBS 223.65]|eukprot:XP_012207116.1 hypothetical protein SPRG_12674 [Saprolegnia parasitica CBS 223.65]
MPEKAEKDRRRLSVRKTSLNSTSPEKATSRPNLRRGSTMTRLPSPKKSPKKQAPTATVEELESREEVINMIHILETDTGEAAQKRQILKLFEWFKAQYAMLSGQLRESLAREQQLIVKCRELKFDVMLNVVKLQTKLQVKDTQTEGLGFFKEECERSWHSIHMAQEREQEALAIINDLRNEITQLESQVKELQRRPLLAEPRRASITQSASLAQLRTPKAAPEADPITTFHEWKAANRVWSPPKSHDRSSALYWGNYTDDRGSPTSGATTPMERAMTAASPTKRPQWCRHLPRV